MSKTKQKKWTLADSLAKRAKKDKSFLGAAAFPMSASITSSVIAFLTLISMPFLKSASLAVKSPVLVLILFVKPLPFRYPPRLSGILSPASSSH